ncbi:hypothetical protein, partial [Leucobacter sp. M11]|uniref:hypothetical protein n=1 Tax=Leucobacter sp. M11 TaxID=2993565 RepID=UPI002D7FA157
MSALRELSRAHALEVLRNGKQLGLMSTWFVMVFLALAAAQFMLSGGTAPSVVQVTGPPAQVAIAEAALRDAGVSVATAAPAGETGAATLAVTLGDDGAVLRGLTTPTTAWGPTVRALSGTGIPYGHITVFDASGELIPDILRSNLGSVLIIGFLSVLLIGGTSPFVTLRARGTLRLLRTVPVRPGVVLAAFLPIRLALCAVMAL